MRTPTPLAALIMYAQYLVSAALWSIFNLHGLAQVLRQSIGQIWAIRRAISQRRIREPDLTLRLPFAEEWTVYNGGVHRRTSHSWSLIGQRYAYDFVVVGEDGRSYRGDPRRPENYLAFGRPILAAADGVVVALRDDVQDYGRAGTGWIDLRTPDMRGNYVVLQHGEDLYTLYAHLRAGSISVQVGERVQAGQPIGACGHSGHSTEPHLHFQLQDRADFFTAIGLPPPFGDFERVTPRGRECVQRGYLERSQRVRPVDHCPQGVVESVEPAPWTPWDLLFVLAVALLALVGILGLVARGVELLLGLAV